MTETCTIYCATADPVDVLASARRTRRGIVSAIDREQARRVENDDDMPAWRNLFRASGHKV